MPQSSTKSHVKSWQARVTSANKAYLRWEEKYECGTLEDFYRGFQWPDTQKDITKRRYAINLFYSSIGVQMPSYLFFRPQVRVDPRPGRSDDELTLIEGRAKLQEDTINTFISYHKTGFDDETEMAVLDAEFRFGIVEVGYTADFIDNPNAGKPLIRDDGTEWIDEAGKEIIQPARVPSDERIFIKWIPAKQFRVSVHDHHQLEKCEWAGYYEWHVLEDIKGNRNYKNTVGLQKSGQLRSEYETSSGNTEEDQARSGMLKIWKIWDNRSRHRYVFADGHDNFLLDEPFEIFPFEGLVFSRDPGGGFYPIPPTYNWLYPQIETNEIRQSQRSHRKKSLRKYWVREGGLTDAEEESKLEQAEEFALIHTTARGDEVIGAIQDAPQDRMNVVYLQQAKDDFNEVSGVGGEERGIAESETATQAHIISARSQIRESFGRVRVGRWLARIAYKVLATLKENASLDFWVKTNVDPQSPAASSEEAGIETIWRTIQSDDLGPLHNDISVAIESLSPVAREAERNAWNNMLATVTNPVLALFLSRSPVLLRKTLGFFGITNQKEIQEVQRAMSESLLIQSGIGGGVGVGATGPGKPNGQAGTMMEQIQQQIQNQLPPA